MYMIRATLAQDGETCWVGWVPDSGEPIEFDTLGAAEEAITSVRSGGQTYDLFEPWREEAHWQDNPYPTISSLEVYEADKFEDQPTVESILRQAERLRGSLNNMGNLEDNDEWELHKALNNYINPKKGVKP